MLFSHTRSSLLEKKEFATDFNSIRSLFDSCNVVSLTKSIIIVQVRKVQFYNRRVLTGRYTQLSSSRIRLAY